MFTTKEEKQLNNINKNLIKILNNDEKIKEVYDILKNYLNKKQNIWKSKTIENKKIKLKEEEKNIWLPRYKRFIKPIKVDFNYEKVRKISNLINKITNKNYNIILKKIQDIEINKKQTLKEICNLIFEKAIKEEKNRELYIKIIKDSKYSYSKEFIELTKKELNKECDNNYNYIKLISIVYIIKLLYNYDLINTKFYKTYCLDKIYNIVINNSGNNLINILYKLILDFKDKKLFNKEDLYNIPYYINNLYNIKEKYKNKFMIDECIILLESIN